MKKIFIDFDGVYSTHPPKNNLVILTNKYNADWVININKEVNSRAQIYSRFEKYCIDVSINIGLNFNIITHKMYLFNSFFYPLGQWINVIDRLVENGTINKGFEVVFSSFSNNSKAFMIEAEGETNGQFLYKKSYFLSYYIKKYLQSIGFKKFRYNKTCTFYSIFLFYLRGVIILHTKFSQLLLYKFFIRKRVYNIQKTPSKERYIGLLSRGIIQSQFIESFYKESNANFSVIINESSISPFRNLKSSKKIFNSFFYAEGYIGFFTLLREYINVIKLYFNSTKVNSNFYNVNIEIKNLIPELAIKQFHLKTYVHSVERSIKFLKRNYGLTYLKHLSFEMLSPFTFFLNSSLKESVVQVQTAAIPNLILPNYVYSDQFYFSNSASLREQSLVNPSMKGKFNVLQNIKYFGLKKKNRNYHIKVMTYFCQPIYADDEYKLIKYLISYSSKFNIKLQIKLHPRSSRSLFDFNNINVLDGIISSQDAIRNSDLVITRTSAIGLDSWFMNVPILFFVNGTLEGDSVSYIPNDYLGKIKENITIDQLKNKLELIIDDFYNHPFQEEFLVANQNIKEKILN